MNDTTLPSRTIYYRFAIVVQRLVQPVRVRPVSLSPESAKRGKAFFSYGLR